MEKLHLLCELANYIDIDDDLGQQDLIDDLSYTFLGKELFSKYSKNELIQLIQNKK